MSHRSKLVAAVVAVAAVLGGAADGAAAYVLELDPAGTIEAPSEGAITFGSSSSIECEVTLDGTLSNEVEARPGAHLGSITEVTIGEDCSGVGVVESVYNLPWAIEFESIEGTLPDEVEEIAGNIEDAGITISAFGGAVRCSYDRLWSIILVPLPFRPYIIPVIFYTTGLEGAFAGGHILCPRTLPAEGGYILSPEQSMEVR